MSGPAQPRRSVERETLERALERVGERLASRGLVGEILLVGGAYMTLILRSRETTKDIDAYFAAHAPAIREAAAGVAVEFGLPSDWLNDAVKGFGYSQPPTAVWREMLGLKIYAPDPAYIFAMKALAARPEDLADLRVLVQHLGLTNAESALGLVVQFVPERLLTPRVQYLIEDLFDDGAE